MTQKKKKIHSVLDYREPEPRDYEREQQFLDRGYEVVTSNFPLGPLPNKKKDQKKGKNETPAEEGFIFFCNFSFLMLKL